MAAPRWPYFVIAVLVAGAMLLLGWQRQVATEIRKEIVREQLTQLGERSRLAAENRQLTAAQVPPAELENLRVDRAAVTGLLAELEALKRRVDEAARNPAPGGAMAESRMVSTSRLDRAVPAGAWRNAGAAVPEAAFETVLWASAGGDIETLAGVLVMDAMARARVAAILARLPAGMRQELGTPERLVALLTAANVPLGSAQILGQYPSSTETRLLAQLFDTDGKSKQILLSMQADGGKWRLVVPGNVVEKYAAMLQTPAVTAETK